MYGFRESQLVSRDESSDSSTSPCADPPFASTSAASCPFFADFQNLLGSVTGAPIVFGFPALFYLRACQLHGKRVSRVDAVGCAVFLGVFLPMFTVLGTVTALRDIAEDWADNGAPFECGLD